MENCTKRELVKETEKLLRMCKAYENIELTYGILNRERYFIPKKYDVNTTEEGFTEVVQAKWVKQSDRFARYKSIEMDSQSSIIIDIMKLVRTM